jgi:two-component system, cell cycle sensor histidine kinase and response regulator CckA
MTSAAADTVLVVDDDEGVRTITSFVLRRQGFEVLQATNGREAVEAVRARGDGIGVVLLDVMMPEMTGHEALPAIREIAPEMPVVFFSGFDESEIAEHLEAPTAYTSFLPKPYRNAQLVEAVLRARDSRG